MGILRHPVLLWASRLLLGVVFLWAAWYKITDLPAFATSIGYYGMVPKPLLPLFATVLAGVEVVTGLALVTGVYRKGAALVVSGMLLVFVVAIATAYVRGKSIECGCFTANLGLAEAEAVRTHMLTRLVEDVAMLLVAINLYLQELASGPSVAVHETPGGEIQ